MKQTIDYMQILELTDDEKAAMYMKCSKKQLIEMLIQCNKIIDECVKPSIYPVHET